VPGGYTYANTNTDFYVSSQSTNHGAASGGNEITFNGQNINEVAGIAMKASDETGAGSVCAIEMQSFGSITCTTAAEANYDNNEKDIIFTLTGGTEFTLQRAWVYDTYLNIIIPTENVQLEVNPTSPGTAEDTEQLNYQVGTNNKLGYKVYINTNQTPNLVCTTLPNYSLSGLSTPSSELENNTWGYKLANSANYLPPSATMYLLQEGDAPILPTTTQMLFGVKVDMNQPSCSYKNTTMITAVPNS
jgi:hypothetical protein